MHLAPPAKHRVHPLDVHLYQIKTGKIERIEVDRPYVNHLSLGIIDRLADELGAVFAC